MKIPKIVFPENDPRVVEAAEILIKKNICHPVLIGEKNISTREKTVLGIDPTKQNVLWQGAEIVANGEADGIVSGAIFATSDVLRAYIKNIGLVPGCKRVHGCFLMEKPGQKLIFTDGAVNIDPTPEIIAESAFLCDEFARQKGLDPRVALLSFSTKGSGGDSPLATKMQVALEIINSQYPHLIADGELQGDAALVPHVAEMKSPESPISGQANILVFPDINAGNIAYKLVERLGGYSATGPILLGFARPAHDLSRGCTAADIVRMAEITVFQCNNN